ncbi:MAG: zinc-dependent alcohol dehydrogenase [bacterium]
MKALVLEQYDCLEYREVPDPQVGPRDVLVEVRACGICGSDIHGMDGSSGRRIPPVIMGHEASGVIVGKGRDVSNWREGDHVTLDSTISCDKCSFCSSGMPNLCDNRRVLGVSCEDYRRDGAFAEYVAVHERTLYGVPEGVSFVEAAMVEPLSVAAHACNRLSPSIGDSVVVIGTGMIGLLVIQVLRAAGCGRILAVDLDPSRLEAARRLGADHGLLSCDVDVPDKVRRLTNGQGADAAFEAVGIGSTLTLATNSVRKGGTVTLIGNLTIAAQLPLQSVVTREISLHGSYTSCGEYAACLDLIRRGTVDVGAIVSAVAPLSDGATWFERLRKRDPGLLKVVLEP